MIAALVPRQTPPNAIEFTFDLDRCNQFLTLIACSLDHSPLRYSLIVVNYIASVLRYLGNCRTLKCGNEEKERIEEWNICHILFMKFRLDSYISNKDCRRLNNILESTTIYIFQDNRLFDRSKFYVNKQGR